MKTNKTTHEMPYVPTAHQLVKQQLPFSDNFRLPFCLAVVMGIGFGFETAPVKAENSETLDIQHYKEPQRVGKAVGKSIQRTKATNPDNIGQVAKELSSEKLAGSERASSGDSPQQSQTDRKVEAVIKPADGKGKLPTFVQADTNGDHFVTKLELQNFPYLLQVFDKVDAGNDGQLEQHEYQNLKMETKREGEIS